MQKLLQNKSITQKIIIAIVFVILFNFTCPCIVQAAGYNFIYQALSWLIVRVTDCIQWIMLVCLTMDPSMVMDHAKWAGDDDTNKDKWEFEWFRDQKIEWPQRHILSPDDIFTGKILLTNINFFTDYTKKVNANTIGTNKITTNGLKNVALDFSSDSTAESLEKLRIAIAKWYITIRNITIVGLLSVLVYIAIRMVITTASSDKSKYQKMLVDWLVSLCLVFTLHYIMAITIGVCEQFTNMLNKNVNEGIYMDAGDRFDFNDETYGDREGVDKPLDNLSTKIRIYTQSSNSTEAFSYALMYLAITGWTLVYFVIYMKRFVYMAFYTLMAPIVALTYPIDKIGDGRSQAFNDWLKQYIYTALQQPFHLLLYTIFIGMAQEIANSNFIYTFVILMMMVKLDSILAKWIGVDQASSTGSTVSEGFQKLLAFRGMTALAGGKSGAGSGGSDGSGKSGGSGGSGNTPTKSTPRTKKGLDGFDNSNTVDNNTDSDNDTDTDNGGGNIRQTQHQQPQPQQQMTEQEKQEAAEQAQQKAVRDAKAQEMFYKKGKDKPKEIKEPGNARRRFSVAKRAIKGAANKGLKGARFAAGLTGALGGLMLSGGDFATAAQTKELLQGAVDTAGKVPGAVVNAGKKTASAVKKLTDHPLHSYALKSRVEDGTATDREKLEYDYKNAVKNLEGKDKTKFNKKLGQYEDDIVMDMIDKGGIDMDNPNWINETALGLGIAMQVSSESNGTISAEQSIAEVAEISKYDYMTRDKDDDVRTDLVRKGYDQDRIDRMMAIRFSSREIGAKDNYAKYLKQEKYRHQSIPTTPPTTPSN